MGIAQHTESQGTGSAEAPPLSQTLPQSLPASRHAAPQTRPLLQFATSNYRNANKRMNKALADIAQTLHIPPFTSYAARHTFASVAAALRIPSDTIAELLGHARTVTDIYIHYDTRIADDALTRIVEAALPTSRQSHLAPADGEGTNIGG